MSTFFLVVVVVLAGATFLKNAFFSPSRGGEKSLEVFARPMSPFSMVLAGLPLLLLVAALAAVSFGYLTSTPSLLLSAFLASLLVVPWTSEYNVAERLGHVAASSVPLVAVLVGAPFLLGTYFTTAFSDQYPLLVVGLIGGFGLLTAVFAASASYALRSNIPLVGFGAASSLAALLLGLFRSNIASFTYSIPLATTAHDAIYWVMQPTAERPEGVRFAASMDAPAFMWLFVALIVLSVIFVLLDLIVPKRKPITTHATAGDQHPTARTRLNQVLLVIIAVVAIAGCLMTLDLGLFQRQLPSQDVFRRLLTTIGGLPPNQLDAIEGSFRLADNTLYDPKDGLVFDRTKYVFDIFFLHLAAVSFILAAVVSFVRGGWVVASNEKVNRINDLALANTEATILVRSSICVGLLIAGVGLYQISYLGVAWLGSPSEWIGIGMFCLTAAVAALFVSRQRQLACFSDVDLRCAAAPDGAAPSAYSKTKPNDALAERIAILFLLVLSFGIVLAIAWGAAYQTLIGFSARLF